MRPPGQPSARPNRSDRPPISPRRALGCATALVAAGWLGLIPVRANAASSGEEVFVVYNLNSAPDSRLVAEHYARKRGVPDKHLLGLTLPTTENITRADFNTRLQAPLLDALEKRGLLTYESQIVPSEGGRPGRVVYVPRATSLRYLVLCYGVPLRILRDASVVELGADRLPESLRRNEASVDSELALLPLSKTGTTLTGVFRNPVYQAAVGADLSVANGILMVARLDGPSLNAARDLVTKAIQAETDGLWGRAYFDSRGLGPGPYQIGDAWIEAAAQAAIQKGFETTLDTNATTFAASLPLPQIALYAGWYDQSVSGPFTRPEVEFMPGAIAYHLYSYSARTVRSQASWVGTLLAKGATVTLGCVDEPYLEATPNLEVFFDRLLNRGFTFGEAAYAAQNSLSWQNTVLGDPLYRPTPPVDFDPAPDLARRRSPYVEWARLRAINRDLARGGGTAEAIARLAAFPETATSAVLRQKLGDLRLTQREPDQALQEYREALKLRPSRQQRIQLQFTAARLSARLDRPDDALALWEDFFRENPAYPDLLAFYREALPVALAAKQAGTARKYEIEIQRLTPAPGTNAAPAGASVPR